MTTQPEAILENELIQQLGGLGYERVTITDEAAILANLKSQLELFNSETLTDKEFAQVVNHLNKGNVFERAKTLRDRFALKKDDGETQYIQFYDSEDWNRNLFQVTNQVTIEGVYKNRYDVTLLVNGLPLVQIELKRRGTELKEAFNQILRYDQTSYWASSGLFRFVQLFVISNGTDTKYFANAHYGGFDYGQTIYWADENNRHIAGLTAFTDAFLNRNHLGKMIAKYVVLNEVSRKPMILRPYQYYAVEAIVERVKEAGVSAPLISAPLNQRATRPLSAVEGRRSSRSNGYIWHTTGSGKTLTSFKAAQVMMSLPEIHKVVFVVDRKDLDYQTAEEFNKFKKDSVDMTTNTRVLVDQLKDDTELVVTTIQKLNYAITKIRYEKQLTDLKDKRMVFIFDECHRSQFGRTHNEITGYFKNTQLFGFTGTPIFEDNAHANEEFGKRTTKDLFHECLHKYVITDAIGDQKVLRFAVEYIGRFKQKGNTFIDIEVEAIDTREAMDDPKRLEKITDYIIANHDRKTHNREFTAMFAVSSIDNLITYYDLFKQKKQEGMHDLNIAAIYTYAANPEDKSAQGSDPSEMVLEDPQAVYAKNPQQRAKLDEIIADYNQLYGESFSTKDGKSFENYYKSISKKIKDRDKETVDEKQRVDILLVVNMFLTGFDARKLNTLYVDKNLRHHGLIQAYSRTNRIKGDKKSQGNILCFRNLKENTDEAVALFSNKDAKEDIFLPPYETLVRKFNEAFGNLLTIAPTVQSVNDLRDENEEAEFIKAFRQLVRAHNVLKTYADFSWEDLGMSEQLFADYKGKYLELYQKAKKERQKEKASILDEVDFGLELLHQDVINVAYILKLLAQIKTGGKEEHEKRKKQLMDMLAGEIEMRSKRELIEKFIEENLPYIEDVDDVPDEFEKFWQEQKVLALNKLCEKENLDNQQFKNLIDAYIFRRQEPLMEDVFQCLENRPSPIGAKEIADRIIERMKEFVEVFVRGISA